jgi:hypothetical protein
MLIPENTICLVGSDLISGKVSIPGTVSAGPTKKYCGVKLQKTLSEGSIATSNVNFEFCRDMSGDRLELKVCEFISVRIRGEPEYKA